MKDSPNPSLPKAMKTPESETTSTRNSYFRQIVLGIQPAQKNPATPLPQTSETTKEAPLESIKVSGVGVIKAEGIKINVNVKENKPPAINVQELATGSKIDPEEKLEVKSEVKSPLFDNTAFERAAKNINVVSFPKQLGLGATAGLVSGVISMKLGRAAALVIGSGIIAYQVAHHQGIVTKDWDKISEEVRNKTKLSNEQAVKTLRFYNNLKMFARSSRVFTVGFIGGFFLGSSSGF